MTTAKLLTVDQLRGYILDTAESDETLQQRLDDTEDELNGRFGVLEYDSTGASDSITEIAYAPGQTMLTLRETPIEMISVRDLYGRNEIQLTQDAVNGYRVRGHYLVREFGTWGRRTTVVYRAADSRSRRRRGLIKLIQLDMNFAPGLVGQSGGPWAESYSKLSDDYLTAREAIMATIGDEELFA